MHVFALLVLCDKQRSRVGVVSENIVHGATLNNPPQNRVGGDILDPFAHAVDDSAISQAFQILFYCS